LASSAPQQVWDPARYARNARFVADLGVPLLDLLALKPGMRILDLGCGDGALTERIVQAGAFVVGVDASPEQVAAAKLRGLDARVADGAALGFTKEFDAVFSNAALHWMRASESVIAGIWRALKPGGRFVAELGGFGNVGALRTALHDALARRSIDATARDPWFFPTADEYRAQLERGGFEVGDIALIPRPTPLPGDIGDWLDTFAGHFLGGFDPAERAVVVNEVREAVRPALQRPDGAWHADYVRLRVVARKQAKP
jgi:SAM-dependent methyltransferase